MAYFTVIEALAGGLLIVSVAIAWRRTMKAMTRLLALEGALVGAIPLVGGIAHRDLQLIVVGVVVMALRGGAFPALIASRVRDEPDQATSGTGRLGTSATLLLCSALVIAAFVIAEPLVALAPTGAARALPVGFVMIFVGAFLLVARSKALAQVIGLVVLDNGIDTIAFLLTSGVPIVVEFGASLDVLLGVLVLSVLTGRMRSKFGGTDLDDLRALHE